MKTIKVRVGIYEHFKGKRYEVLGVGKHSETLENFVIYRPLHKDKTADLWIRPIEMFLEEVIINGKMIPRFRYIAESRGRLA